MLAYTLDARFETTDQTIDPLLYYMYLYIYICINVRFIQYRVLADGALHVSFYNRHLCSDHSKNKAREREREKRGGGEE